MKWLGLSFFLFLSNSVISVAASDDTDTAATFICRQVLGSQEYVYHNHFAPSFIEAVPLESFQSLMSEIVDTMGECARPNRIGEEDGRADFQMISATGNYATMVLSLDSSGLINSLLFKGMSFPARIIETFDDAVMQLNALGSATSLSIATFGGAQKNLRAFDRHPIASGFKLYVLGAVADAVQAGRLSWQDEFPIVEEYKSLPSGIMHTWEDGRMVSLSNFAEYMIKISDNTATDHLIDISGRDRVHEQLRILGNDFLSANQPFLTTAEAFKLKWAAPNDLTQSYLLGDESRRTAVLSQELKQISLDQVGQNGIDLSKPSFINEIEWFASTNDLCEAMSGLKEKKSSEVLAAMSKNVPFISVGESEHWTYGGFKGGSEPGVLSATYLLKSQEDRWGCVSMAWHDEASTVNQWLFFDTLEKVLALAEREI